MSKTNRVTTKRGDANLNVAGRDLNIHQYLSGGSTAGLDIIGVLDSIRNLRKIHQDILSKATPGTGDWFLKIGPFLIWLDPNGNLKILWGTGIREWPMDSPLEPVAQRVAQLVQARLS